MSSPGDERARLFVALTLPSGVLAALVSWRSGALGGIDGFRALPRASLHVTLCFLGSLPVSVSAAVGEACAQAGAGHRAGPLTLGDVLWLPRRRPRVVAVGVVDPSGGLRSLQAAVATALVAGGWYEPETRPFLAHVTVARAGGHARVRPPAAVPAPPPLAFAGESVTLFRSRPGSVYEPLRVCPLTDPGSC